MKMKKQFILAPLLITVAFALCIGVAWAEKKMPETVQIKLEGAKMAGGAGVKFSHITHTEKNKIDCAVCHHKDTNPKEPEKCETCHQLKDVKNNAPIAKDAFHKKCQTCHKDSAAKGVTAPTKCMECHK